MSARNLKHVAFLAVTVCFLMCVPWYTGRALGYEVFQTYGNYSDNLWQDANKSYPRSGDSLLCWAASAANTLTWGGWNTQSFSTAQSVFQVYKDHWTDKGSLPDVGWQWWFSGNYPAGYPASYPSPDSWSIVDVPGAGGYWSGYDLNNYYHDSFVWDQISPQNSYWDTAGTMKYIDDYLKSGAGVSLAIRGGGGHAVTVWGFEYDATRDPIADPYNYYKSIYITDSDDIYLNAPYYGMTSYPVSWDATNNHWDLGGGYAGWYISEVYALDARVLAPLESSWNQYAGYGLDFSDADLELLTKMYNAGKGNQPWTPIEIDGYRWSYFDEQFSNRSFGQTWRDPDTGVVYFYLGSGIMGEPLGGGGADVPEPSTLLLLLPFVGFGLRKMRSAARR